MGEGKVVEPGVVDPEAAVEFEAAGHSPAVNRHIKPQRYALLDSLVVLAKRKSLILISVCAATLTAVLLAVLLPDTYTATVTVLPSRQSQGFSTELLQGLNLPVSGRQPSEIYLAILRSETIANGLIDRFSLMQVYGAGLREETSRKLAERTEIDLGKDGVISISVDDRNSQRAAELANGYVEEIEALMKKLGTQQAARQSTFLASQVKAAGAALTNAEQALKETQERTGLVVFDPQTEKLIEAAAWMRARVAAQEVRVQGMRAFAASENPELARANQELAALRDQESKLEMDESLRKSINVPLEKVPAARVEYEHNAREAKFREALLGLLTRQLQAAKLNEARTDLMIQPALQLLDKAVPPERESAPHRWLIVLLTTLLALPVAASAALVLEKIDSAKRRRKPPARVPLYVYNLQKQPENIRKSG